MVFQGGQENDGFDNSDDNIKSKGDKRGVKGERKNGKNESIVNSGAYGYEQTGWDPDRSKEVYAKLNNKFDEIDNQVS